MIPNLIIHNVRCYTQDPARPWAEAVACANGRFLAVGDATDILTLAGPQTVVLDGNGRLLLPGLIDAHVHFVGYAVNRQQLKLFGVATLDEVRRKVAEAVQNTPPSQWIIGAGWDENLWGKLPTAQDLDDIAPHHPVALSRMDMHTWLINSYALDLAGLTAETPDPPESQIGRDANGRPNGILREWNAINLVSQFIPPFDETTVLRWTAETIHEAHQLGLTGIHDQRVEHEGRDSFRIFQILNRRGELSLRVHMHIAADHLAQANTLGLLPGFGDDRLWLGHAKFFADGTMGSRTAWMLESFEGETDNTGVVVTPSAEMWQTASAAAAAGFSISVHAIGDRAVREILDVLAERQPHDQNLLLPHRIEHVQLIHPADIPRLAQKNIIASVQPVHLQTDWPTADKVWGERARYAYAFRSLLDNGARLAFGSDAPVAPLNPMLGIFAAVTRQDETHLPDGGWYPQERLTVAEAIEAYTLVPALLAGKTAVQGAIRPGYWADAILLSANLFEIPPAEIPTTTVDLTIFNGHIVWQKP